MSRHQGSTQPAPTRSSPAGGTSGGGRDSRSHTARQRTPGDTTRRAWRPPTGRTPDAARPTIALVGGPNVGKSTLFNALAGARAATGNWPGTTIEVERGRWRCQATAGAGAADTDWTLIDLPGAYSLEASSPDEALARDAMMGDATTAAPDVILVVVDAAHLARSLYLVAELRERPLRLVIAVTMVDIARRHGLGLDLSALSQAVGVPCVAIDPRRKTGLAELTQAVADQLSQPVPGARTIDPGADLSDDLGEDGGAADPADERFTWLTGVVAAAQRGAAAAQQFSDRVDRIVLSPVAGPILFLAVMWAVFEITTVVAAPLQAGLGWIFSNPVSQAVVWALNQVGLGGGWVEGLVVGGLISGVGLLLSFTPLLALVFLLLALLEDSGYLARAAVVTDRLMAMLGLPGKAFLPLVIGFGCNVPAITATRVLSSGRQRLLTALLVPFTACSARLTVFVMVGTIFFGRWAGTAVFAMYVASIGLVVLIGLMLRRTLWRAMPAEALVIDLPVYQTPSPRLMWASTWIRLKGFLQTAAGLIVGCVVVIWLIQAIPVGPGGFGQVAVEDSLYGWIARAIAPLLAPTGFGAWQTVAALAVGFIAKEAVIASWGQIYATGGDIGLLGANMQHTFAVSSGGHPLAAAAAFMVFFLAYTPCAPTLAAQRREIGWRWTGVGVAIQLAVAVVAAIVVFQLGRLIV